MKIAGLITEYNPFHNGHLYHIQKAKELTDADYLIVIMSGDFVQRGGPAILPKDVLHADGSSMWCFSCFRTSRPLCHRQCRIFRLWGCISSRRAWLC